MAQAKEELPMPSWMENLHNPKVAAHDSPQTPSHRWAIGPTTKAEESFREKYAELRSYKQFYGHSRVPATRKKLYSFVRNIRSKERKRELWKHWKDDLELIGFEFQIYKNKVKQEVDETKQNPELRSCSKEEYMKQYKNLEKQRKFVRRHNVYLNAKQIKEVLLPVAPLPDEICNAIKAFIPTPPHNLRWMRPNMQCFYGKGSSLCTIQELPRRTVRIDRTRIVPRYAKMKDEEMVARLEKKGKSEKEIENQREKIKRYKSGNFVYNETEHVLWVVDCKYEDINEIFTYNAAELRKFTIPTAAGRQTITNALVATRRDEGEAEILAHRRKIKKRDRIATRFFRNTEEYTKYYTGSKKRKKGMNSTSVDLHATAGLNSTSEDRRDLHATAAEQRLPS
jgi:hypothetical protein